MPNLSAGRTRTGHEPRKSVATPRARRASRCPGRSWGVVRSQAGRAAPRRGARDGRPAQARMRSVSLRSSLHGLETVHPLDLDRYLAAFDDRHVPLYRFDVVVVGGGAAGGVAALRAAAEGASVALLAKAGLHETNTQHAQGGMAAVLSPKDSVESHVTDTLRVGCGLAERSVVLEVVQGGPQAVEHLRELGAEFDRGVDGGLELSREGGHTHARIIHAHGDATGLEIQR